MSELLERVAGIAEVTEGRTTGEERLRSKLNRAADSAESEIARADTAAEGRPTTAERMAGSSRGTAAWRNLRPDFVVLAEAALLGNAPAEAVARSRDRTEECIAAVEGTSSRRIVGDDSVVAPAATDTSTAEAGQERRRKASIQRKAFLVAGATDKRKERIVADSDKSIAAVVAAVAVDTATECRLHDITLSAGVMKEKRNEERTVSLLLICFD